MRTISSVSRALVLAAISFTAGWLWHSQSTAPHLTRVTEERNLAMRMASESLVLSDKALSHSLSSAETLEICLGKLGLHPAAGPSGQPRAPTRVGFAQFRP